MGLTSLFGKLTSGKKHAAATETVEYQGYLIRPTPQAEGSQYYTCGVISKTFPEGLREHRFIRADTHASFDAAAQHAVVKARQIIDEQGDRIFEGP
ncbi:MAG: hypothetical protein GWN37_10245 [Gammaproteobacteria bacterium]|nr:hypothetical protein [Gammaproteobacteria bacterium]